MDKYWLFVLIGILISVVVYTITRSNNLAKEPFTDPPPAGSSSSTGAASSSSSTSPVSSTSLPQVSKLEMYINSFNMAVVDAQKTVAVTVVLDGYNRLKPLSQLLQYVLINKVTAGLNLIQGAVRISDVATTDTITNVTLLINYDSQAAASTAITNGLATNIVSTTIVQDLVKAGMNSLTSMTVSGTPTQGAAVSNANNTYNSAGSSWLDFSRNTTANANTKAFSIVSATPIPATIKSAEGLPLKGVKLVGPPSKNFANDNGVLESFSCTWFMKINSTNFGQATTPKIMVYQMFAETPNRIQLSIQDSSVSAVVVEVVVGKATTKYQWTIPKTTIMSNGNTTLYALVFDKPNKRVTFYIGDMAYPSTVTLDETYPIKLGLSQIVINDTPRYVSLDANLLAFTYYSTVLSDTDLKAMAVYFQNEAGGVYLLQQTAQQEAARALQLQTELESTMTSYVGLQDQLNKCTAAKTAAEVAAKTAAGQNANKWKIKLSGDFDDVSTKDVKQCSPISVKKYGSKTETVKMPDNSSTKEWYRINYPSKAVSKSDAAAPPPPAPTPTNDAYNSLAKTAYSSPTTTPTPVPETKKESFWERLFIA